MPIGRLPRRGSCPAVRPAVPRCSRNQPINPNHLIIREMPLGVVGRSKRMTHERQTSYDPQQYPSPAPVGYERALSGVFASRTRHEPTAGRSAGHTKPNDTHQRQLTSPLGLPPASPWWFAFFGLRLSALLLEPKMRIAMEGHRKHLVLRMCAKGGVFGVFCVENGIPRQVEARCSQTSPSAHPRPTSQPVSTRRAWS